MTEKDILKEDGGRPFLQGTGNREQGTGNREQAHFRSGAGSRRTFGADQGAGAPSERSGEQAHLRSGAGSSTTSLEQGSEIREITDFNISHSADIIAVSYVRGPGSELFLRTGCDVQLVRERVNTSGIAKQFFTPAENEYIFTQKKRGNVSAFFEIWVLKECYIKLHGLSVFDMALTPSFVNADGSLNLSQDNASFFLYKLTGQNNEQYFLAAAIKGAVAVPSIRRFSDSVLSCEQIDIGRFTIV